MFEVGMGVTGHTARQSISVGKSLSGHEQRPKGRFRPEGSPHFLPRNGGKSWGMMGDIGKY